jgi:hypothetical protein
MSSTTTTTKVDLVKAIAAATSAAVTQLFSEHPKDHFYYCALVTTGEALAPNLTAWSSEALDAAVGQSGGGPDVRADLKWAYGDSPFFCFGEEHFTEVRRLFTELGRPDPFNATEWHRAVEFRMSAMEEAMAQLEASGLFGRGAARAGIVVNVECMPPDHTNVERARRLNPPEALTAWLDEAAEPA